MFELWFPYAKCKKCNDTGSICIKKIYHDIDIESQNICHWVILFCKSCGWEDEIPEKDLKKYGIIVRPFDEPVGY